MEQECYVDEFGYTVTIVKRDNVEICRFKTQGDPNLTIETSQYNPHTPSIEQQILYENQYQTMLLEMGGIRQ